MITQFFLSIFTWLWSALLQLLPLDTGQADAIASGFSAIGAFIHAFDWLFPIDTLVSAAAIVVLYEGIVWLLGFLRLITPFIHRVK